MEPPLLVGKKVTIDTSSRTSSDRPVVWWHKRVTNILKLMPFAESPDYSKLTNSGTVSHHVARSTSAPVQLSVHFLWGWIFCLWFLLPESSSAQKILLPLPVRLLSAQVLSFGSLSQPVIILDCLRQVRKSKYLQNRNLGTGDTRILPVFSSPGTGKQGRAQGRAIATGPGFRNGSAEGM